VEENSMDSNYVYLCGLMWCRFGQQEAGSELMRAVGSADPDVKALALAMLSTGCRSLLKDPMRAAKPSLSVLAS
jgi:hypothetical protein